MKPLPSILRDTVTLSSSTSIEVSPKLCAGTVDVITRLGDAASFETVDAVVKDVEGIHVRVATPAALYRLKKGTVRPLDRQDAAALRERFDLQDEDEP